MKTIVWMALFFWVIESFKCIVTEENEQQLGHVREYVLDKLKDNEKNVSVKADIKVNPISVNRSASNNYTIPGLLHLASVTEVLNYSKRNLIGEFKKVFESKIQSDKKFQGHLTRGDLNVSNNTITSISTQWTIVNKENITGYKGITCKISGQEFHGNDSLGKKIYRSSINDDTANRSEVATFPFPSNLSNSVTHITIRTFNNSVNDIPLIKARSKRNEREMNLSAQETKSNIKKIYKTLSESFLINEQIESISTPPDIVNYLKEMSPRYNKRIPITKRSIKFQPDEMVNHFEKSHSLDRYRRNNVIVVTFISSMGSEDWFQMYDQIFRTALSSILSGFLDQNSESMKFTYITPTPLKKGKYFCIHFLLESILEPNQTGEIIVNKINENTTRLSIMVNLPMVSINYGPQNLNTCADLEDHDYVHIVFPCATAFIFIVAIVIGFWFKNKNSHPREMTEGYEINTRRLYNECEVLLSHHLANFRL